MTTQLDFIHRFVAAPTHAKSPLVLLMLHGTGGDENDLLPLGRELDPEAAILSPRGKVSENGQARFFRRLAEGVFDEADVARRASELATFIAAAADEYQFDRASVVAIGYSNGANVAAAMMLLGCANFAGAILLRAMVPLRPIAPPKLSGTPILISEGAHDPIVSRNEAEGLTQMLRDGGANVQLRFADAGHGLTETDVEQARAWLAQLA